MFMTALPTSLSWQSKDWTLQEVHSEYAMAAADSLGELIGLLQRSGSMPSASTLTQLRCLPDVHFGRFLLAPETTCRLFWPKLHKQRDVARFLESSIAAEAVRAGVMRYSLHTVWSATGDICILPTGLKLAQQVVKGAEEIPVDFESPFAAATEPDDAHPATLPRRILTDAQRCLALNRLGDAFEIIFTVSPHVLDFVTLYTKVLVLQGDPELPDQFASGSSGQYVGRSALWNVHLPFVDPIDVADAIVHEAIHSLLYMQERLEPWVLEPALYGPTPCTVSPWTGNELALRPFMQACFVWYGLMHFWLLALEAGIEPSQRVRERLCQTLLGFVKGPLTDQLRAYNEHIAAELVAAIQQMYDTVNFTIDTSSLAFA